MIQSHISLNRLNEIATPIVLEDFSVSEAVELIEHIGKSAEKKISTEIKTYVLEFAQGFPWLLKRTMAHIVKFLKNGSIASDLIPATLRLDDLFNEELDELDEIERDYLVRIASRLPATYQELDRAFDVGLAICTRAPFRNPFASVTGTIGGSRAFTMGLHITY